MTNEEAIKYLKWMKEGCALNSKTVKALDLAISALERDRWISVEERLPEETDELVWVLTARYEGEVWPAYHWNGGWSDECGSVGDVTHWMPLPEPPKEET